MKQNDTFIIFGKEMDNRKLSVWLICGIVMNCALMVIFSGKFHSLIPALLFTTLLLGAYHWFYKPGKGSTSHSLLIISGIATAAAVGIAIVVEQFSHYGI